MIKVVNDDLISIAHVLEMAEEYIEESFIPITYNADNGLKSLLNAAYRDDVKVHIVYTPRGEPAGFSISVLDNDFYTETLGYISKFYVRKGFRNGQYSAKLIKVVNDFFDSSGVVQSFASAAGDIGSNKSYIKFMSRHGYTQNDGGVLIRRKNNG